MGRVCVQCLRCKCIPIRRFVFEQASNLDARSRVSWFSNNRYENCMPILFISNINSWPTHAERLCVRVHAGVRAQERLDHSRLL